jgi:hypothetical protein
MTEHAHASGKAMKAIEAMITWEPADSGGPGRVLVIRHADPDYGRSEDLGLQMSMGSCDAEWEEMSDRDRVLQLFLQFHSMVVYDGIDPQIAHREFSKIDEFRYWDQRNDSESIYRRWDSC